MNHNESNKLYSLREGTKDMEETFSVNHLKVTIARTRLK